MPEPRSRRAVLLDRDGTINVEGHYLHDPEQVALLPGAAAAIRAFAAAGYPAIVCTNQSGIARGLISLAQYRAVRRRLDELLAAEGASIADTFTCPHHADFTGACACRKPGTGLYERAAATHDLDLSRCLFVGDRARDVDVAHVFGGLAAMIDAPDTPRDEVERMRSAQVPLVTDLVAAATLLIPRVT